MAGVVACWYSARVQKEIVRWFVGRPGTVVARLVHLVRKGMQLVHSLPALQQAQVDWGALVHPAVWQ